MPTPEKKKQIEAELQSLGFDITKLKSNVKPEPNYGKAALAGLGKSIPGLAVKGAVGLATGELPKTDYEAKTTGEKVVKFAAEFGPDLLVPFGWLGKVGKGSFTAAKMLGKQGLKQGVKEATKVATKDGLKGAFLKDAIKSTAREYAKPYLSKTLLKRVGLTAKGLAKEGATIGSIFSAKSKIADNIDNSKSALQGVGKSAVVGAGIGALTGVAIGGAGAALNKGLKTIADKTKVGNLSKRTIDEINKTAKETTDETNKIVELNSLFKTYNKTSDDLSRKIIKVENNFKTNLDLRNKVKDISIAKVIKPINKEQRKVEKDIIDLVRIEKANPGNTSIIKSIRALNNRYNKLELSKAPEQLKNKIDRITKLELRTKRYPEKQKLLRDNFKQYKKLKEEELLLKQDISSKMAKYNIGFNQLDKYQSPLKGVGPLAPIDTTTEIGKKTLWSKINESKLREKGISDFKIKTIMGKNIRSLQYADANMAINDVYRKTGVNATPEFNNALRLKNEHTYWREPLDKTINEFENYYAKNAVPKDRFYDLIEGRIPINVANKEEVKLVNKFKETSDYIYKELQNIFPEKDFGYIENYFPRFMKSGIAKGQDSNVILKLKGQNVNISPTEKRLLEEVPELMQNVMEKDPAKALDRLATIVERAKIKANISETLDNKIFQLEARGYTPQANLLRNTQLDLLNLPRADKQANVKLFTHEIAERSAEELSSFLTKMNAPVSTIEKLKNELYNGMYNVVIGLNAPLQFAQKFQTWIIGTPEIGAKWVRVGNSKYKSKEMKKVLNEVKQYLYPREISVSEVAYNKRMLEGPAGKVSKILNLPSKLGMKLFDKSEKLNREKAFTGSYLKLKSEGVNYKTLDTLTASQKVAVQNALKNGGLEAAAREYGLIMSDRINFIYNAVNKPAQMKTSLGELIPFTTWRRGQWNTFYGDLINQKNPLKKLSQRTVLPHLTIGLASKITGLNLTTADPTSGLTSILTPTPFPMLSDVSKGGGLNSILKRTIPVYAVGARIADKDNKLPAIARILNIKKNK